MSDLAKISLCNDRQVVARQEDPGLNQTVITVRRGGRDVDPAIRAIDGSFTTDAVFEVHATGDGFTLTETAVSPPIKKEFPDDQEGVADEPDRFVAIDDHGVTCGFIDLTYEQWNRRLTIADFEISPKHRRRGIGRRLLELAVRYGRELGARTLWLEVSNVNAPAIRAYLRMGFTVCGLDMSLYRGTECADETAVFMSQDLTCAGT
jgi:ribosomal protein S18 acetylase RimI-like enzyme